MNVIMAWMPPCIFLCKNLNKGVYVSTCAYIATYVCMCVCVCVLVSAWAHPYSRAPIVYSFFFWDMMLSPAGVGGVCSDGATTTTGLQ